MKKTVKRLWAVLLAVVMSLAPFFGAGITVYAAEGALEDGTYKLPNLVAGPSAMFNHFVAESKKLIVTGETATIQFITDGSTASIQKYSRIVLGKSSEMLTESYAPDSALPKGTAIIEGILQEKEKTDDPDKYLFEISLSKSDAEELLSNDKAEDIYITVWNKVGAKEDKIPGWYKPSNDIYLSLGTLGEKITAPEDPAEEADYTKVDAALKTVPADLSEYTEASASAVTQAVNAVERGLKKVDQEKVNKMAEAIETAVAGLEKKTAEDPAEGEKVELTITNNTGMFKAVSAHLETADGQTMLVMALSGSGYKNLFKGTYEQAVANGDHTENWIAGYTNEDGKLEFKIPVAEGETYMPLVAVSQSYYDKYKNGENSLERAFYPRQAEIDAKAKTLITGDYEFSQEIAVTNNVKMLKVEGATLDTVGGPNSNNYKSMLELKMGSVSYGEAFVGSYAEAGAATETIKLDENNIFSIPVKWVETFGQPETLKNLANGEPFYLSLKSANNGTWYERIATLDEAAGTLVLDSSEADYTAVDAAKAKAEALDRSLYKEESLAAVEAAVEKVEKGKLESQQAEVDAMAKAIEDAIDALELTPEAENELLKKEIEDAAKEIKDLEKKVDTLEKQLAAANAGESYSDAVAAELEKQLDAAKGELAAAETKLKTAEEAMKALEAEKEKLEAAKTELEKALEAAKADNAGTTGKIAELQNQIEELQKKLEEAGEKTETPVGWKQVGGKWFYYLENGKAATGWLLDNGTWYYLNADGSMATGWIKVGDLWYYLNSNGAMASNEWIGGYWLGADGAWTYNAIGSWKLDRVGYWFGDTNGWYAANGTCRIDNVVYVFNAAGYWVQ